MSDFKAKMHQIQFRLQVSPTPSQGAYPDLAEFKESFCRGCRQKFHLEGRGSMWGADKRVAEGISALKWCNLVQK